MATTSYVFKPSDLVGGHVALDLVNTVTGRESRPTDWIDTYERLLEWASLTGAFDQRSLRTLRRLSVGDEHGSVVALDGVRTLRESVYGVVVAIIRGTRAPGQALATLERCWKDAAAAARLVVSGERAQLEVTVDGSGLHYLAHALALAAFDLLQALPRDRTRMCADPRCTWIFIDTSRGSQRKWCDMASCGNAAKSRRHYERTRAQGRSG
jgi:predicted RNA-binding Zn ribbon-like protein